jgi:hypothetical protein
MTWSGEQQEAFAAADELEIAVRRDDGSLRDWTPIWVVRAQGEVYVRTWQLRTTGWYGAARRSGRARVRVPGVEAEVAVVEVGREQRAAVDAAYAEKYARYGATTLARMTGDEAAASTLRLTPSDASPPTP